MFVFIRLWRSRVPAAEQPVTRTLLPARGGRPDHTSALPPLPDGYDSGHPAVPGAAEARVRSWLHRRLDTPPTTHRSRS